MRSRILIVCVMTIPAAVALVLVLMRPARREFQLSPLPAAAPAELPVKVAGTEVGTGSGLDDDPQKAVREALAAALQDAGQKTPDFAILYVASGSDTNRVLRAARSVLGPNTKIFGGHCDSRRGQCRQPIVRGPDGLCVRALTAGRAFSYLRLPERGEAGGHLGPAAPDRFEEP